MKNSVLIALDGSGASYEAFDQMSSNFVNQPGARLVLLHVVVDDHEASGTTGEDQEIRLDKRFRALLEHLEVVARHRGIQSVETTVVRGDPAEQIVAVAEEKHCGSIVLGASGLSGGNLVGGCTARVIRKAQMPVIVVP